jgi:hypothetical protein
VPHLISGFLQSTSCSLEVSCLLIFSPAGDSLPNLDPFAGLWDGIVGAKGAKPANAVITKTLLHGVTSEILRAHANDPLGIDPRLLVGKKTILAVIGNPHSKALYSEKHVGEALESLLVTPSLFFTVSHLRLNVYFSFLFFSFFFCRKLPKRGG